MSSIFGIESLPSYSPGSLRCKYWTMQRCWNVEVSFEGFGWVEAIWIVLLRFKKLDQRSLFYMCFQWELSVPHPRSCTYTPKNPLACNSIFHTVEAWACAFQNDEVLDLQWNIVNLCFRSNRIQSWSSHPFCLQLMKGIISCWWNWVFGRTKFHEGGSGFHLVMMLVCGQIARGLFVLCTSKCSQNDIQWTSEQCQVRCSFHSHYESWNNIW